MIFIEKMKNLKIYKTKTFLPTLLGNKKKGSAVLLMTPNFESSKRLMNNEMFVNSNRYSSYYLERDVSYYINSNVVEEVDESAVLSEQTETEEFFLETKRSELPDSEFGVPEERKFPLDTEAHVRSAIKFFNYVEPKYEAELARRIIAKMKKFNITDVHVSEKNRFSKYYHPKKESSVKESADEHVKKCKFCGSEDILVKIEGEPVYICKQCGKYLGTVPCREETESIKEDTFDINFLDEVLLTEEASSFDDVDDDEPIEPSNKTKASGFEKFGGSLFNQVILDKNKKIFIIKGINFKKFLLRLKEMYQYRGITKLFEKKYSYFDMKLWKAGLKSKSSMRIASLEIPLYFALEIFNIFHDLAEFYGLNYYKQICKNIYHKTWISNWEKIPYKELDTSKLPAVFNFNLKDYQEEFIKKYGKLKHIYDLDGYILSFEQGLGKTLTSIALAEVLDKDQVIIVCPNSLKENWAYEIKSYYKAFAVESIWLNSVYVHNVAKFSKARDPKFIIVNQDAIDKIIPMLKKNKNSMIIVDEVHNFRDIDSQRSKSLIKLKETIDCKDNLLMSGTPIKSNAVEIIPMLRMIDPYFTEELAKIYKKAFNNNSIKVADVIKSRFSRIIYRKTKDEVLHLPNKTVTELRLECKTEAKYLSDAVRVEINKEINAQISTRKADVEKYKAIFEEMVTKYSSASKSDTKEYLQYISKADNFVKIDDDEADLKYIKFKYFLRDNVYPNITDTNELKKFNEAKTNYVYFYQSCIGKAIGKILPPAKANCYKDIFRDNLDKFITYIDKSTKKTIIFTPFLDVAKYVYDTLTEKGIGAVKIIGETSSKMEEINKFKMDDSIDVLVATVQTLSTGVTLTEADQMFFLGTPYRKADFDQACDRIHRIGQTNDVNIYIVLLKSSKANITDRIFDIMNQSGESSEALIYFG